MLFQGGNDLVELPINKFHGFGSDVYVAQAPE